MSGSTTMTIRVSEDLKQRLGVLARDTHRSRSYLAAEAVATYVDRELAIIAGVQRGMKDVETGNVVGHDQAMSELYAVIDDAQSDTGR